MNFIIENQNFYFTYKVELETTTGKKSILDKIRKVYKLTMIHKILVITVEVFCVKNIFKF